MFRFLENELSHLSLANMENSNNASFVVFVNSFTFLIFLIVGQFDSIDHHSIITITEIQFFLSNKTSN